MMWPRLISCTTSLLISRPTHTLNCCFQAHRPPFSSADILHLSYFRIIVFDLPSGTQDAEGLYMLILSYPLYLALNVVSLVEPSLTSPLLSLIPYFFFLESG